MGDSYEKVAKKLMATLAGLAPFEACVMLLSAVALLAQRYEVPDRVVKGMLDEVLAGRDESSETVH